ncbi:MAG: encapsulin-associated ferritin-like protein [Spirochaetota bacterium]
MSEQYHEPANELSPQDRDIIRALISLKEEVEATFWYHQRVATASDEEIKGILAHNRDEEMEHAVMTLEWLRRNMPGWDEVMRTYLFKDKPILELEEEAEEEEDKPDDLGIGGFKGR